MQHQQDQQNGQSRTQRAVSGRSSKRSPAGPIRPSMFSRRMQVYAYTATTVILIGLLFGVGYLYKTKQVETTDSILMFILAQILGSWVALTNKIFRITTVGSEKNAD